MNIDKEEKICKSIIVTIPEELGKIRKLKNTKILRVKLEECVL